MNKHFYTKALVFTACTLMLLSLSQTTYAASNQKTLIVNELNLFDLDQPITNSSSIKRGQFSQILCNLAKKNTSIDAAYLYAYPDVSLDYWAADYINTAVLNGWMTGNLNGYFNPEKPVTYSQALYGVLKVIGFSDTQIPKTNNGIISFAKKQGLCKGISLSATNPISKSTLNNLLYNALKVKINDKIYGNLFGCTLNASDEINLNEYIAKNLDEPIVADSSWKEQIPFSLKNATIYRDNKKVKATSIMDYDVLYYSTSLKTVWAYSKKAIGIVNAISPSSINPDKVKIGSTEYSLGTDVMKEEFSILGNTTIGNHVTALLGMDGSIVGLVGKATLNDNYTGIILSSTEELMEGSLSETATCINIILPSGVEREVITDAEADSYQPGELVSVTSKDEEITITKLSRFNYNKVAGKVSTDGKALSDYVLSSDVEILDYYDKHYTTVFTSRIAGITLSNDDILYYELNQDNEIHKLILSNVTHDFYSYGIVTTSSSNSINYILDGKTATATYDEIDNSIRLNAYAPAALLFDENVLVDVFPLTRVYIKSYSTHQLVDNYGNEYMIPEDIPYYYHENLTYKKISIDDVDDISKYYIYCYTDMPVNEGGLARMVILEKKS